MSQSTQLQIFSKAADIAVASPQVVAHRVARMALAGPVLNDRDRKEFTGMVQEKQLAFAQSFMAWNTEILRWQMQWQMQMFGAMVSGNWQSMANRMLSPQPLMAAAERATAKAMEPVRRKAVANAKRLSKTSL